MLCPECGTSHTRVVETRKEEGGLMVRRRHECGNEHRFTSYQLHEAVVRNIGMGQVRARLPQLASGIRRRQLATATKTAVLQHLRAGKTHQATSKLVGCSTGRVSRIKRDYFQEAS
jgi:transcriptional regulator NrdR family protein